MPNESPPPPSRVGPSADWEHFTLYEKVREAISALPAYFRTETFIAGVAATDIHTLNSVLGATIEDQVVQTLNAMRMVWDPDEHYALYSFIRQAQTFPDVRLQKADDPTSVLMGIELKGWYLLAKEGEPSFRFTVTAAACNAQDLIVVVPWVLAQVISGRPICFSPYIEGARHAAEYRNYHWQHLRSARSDTAIVSPESVTPYPRKSDLIADHPASDAGGNFGRFARTGLMDTYLAEMKQLQLCGVRIAYWLTFLRAFQDARSEASIKSALKKLADEVASDESIPSAQAESILVVVQELRKLTGLADD